MLTFFTDPYPDELIYSAIARYHYYIGNIDYKDTLEELFGKRSIIPNMYIASNLDNLVEQLGRHYNVEELINKHTIFPFYSPFMQATRKDEILDDIRYKNGGAIYTRLGMVAGGICRKESICYCIECVKRDVDSYGEAYIHREHQLEGIFICPHHGIYLRRYRLNHKNSSRLSFIRLEEEYLSKVQIGLKDSALQDKLYTIAKLAYKLLYYDTSGVDKEIISKAYKSLLYEKGLVAINKTVRQQELYEAFTNFYGEKLLLFLQSNIDNDNDYNWLRVITRASKRGVHPIRHLLLINFLTGDIDAFFSKIKDNYNPFGKSPWLCLNKASDHYRKPLITNLSITPDYKTRLPVGTFTCNCGFIYSRRGPDINVEDSYKIGRIKQFGHEWDMKLKELLKNNKYGLRETARIMGCDPKTIIKKDKELQIYYFSKELNFSKAITENKVNELVQDENIDEYKKNILAVIKQNTALTRTQIRCLVKKEYAYLYKKDKVWLFENLPQKEKAIQKNIGKVDWEQRDKKILALVDKKYIELLQRNIPVRITKSLIGKELGLQGRIEKYDKIMAANQYLDSILETVEEFQIRRCKTIINQKENYQVRLWELQREAGIRTTTFNNIKSELEKYIEFKLGDGNEL